MSVSNTTSRWLARRAELGAALVVLAVLIAAFFSPLLRGDTYQDVAARENEVYPWAAVHHPFPPTLHFDQPDQFYPYQVFINRALRAGELPLWNPDSFAGQPFFASANSMIAYPPRVPLALLLPATRVHDVLTVLHVLGSGVAMYLLLRAAALSFAAALFGASVWAVNSFTLGWLPFEGVVALACWLPAALVLFQRALVHRSWRASLGLAVVLALLFSAGFLGCLLVLDLLACYALPVLGKRWWGLRGKRRAAVPLILSDVAAFLPLVLMPGLIAVQLLPTAELVGALHRTALPYAEYLTFSLPPRDLLYFFLSPPFAFASSYADLGVVHDAVFGNLPYEALGVTPLTDPYHSLLFLGTPTALLALLGLGARGWLAALARWLAVAIILVALGTPVAWLAYHLVPGASVVKPLGRFLLFFDFAAVVLAAYGVDRLLGWLSRPRPARPFVSPSLRYALICLLALLSLAQLHHVGERLTRHQPADPVLLQPATPLVGALRDEQSGRILPVSVNDALVRFPFDRSFYGASMLTLGLPSASGYEILLPGRSANLWRLAGEGASPDRVLAEPLYWSYAPAFAAGSVRYDLLPRLGVTHIVTPPDIERDPAWTPALVQRAGLELVYAGTDGRVYRVRAALPRAYLVRDCEQVAGPAEALARFADPAFNPTRTVLLEAADAGAECAEPGGAEMPPAGRAEVVARSLNTMTLQVDVPESGWLVIAESWDPGWQATLDGAAVKVLPGNYAFRALRVPAGTHTVELRYRPLSFVIGAVLTALAGVALGAVVSWPLLCKARRHLRRRG